VLHLVVVALMVSVLPEDDAFITYRYADNFARGAGFVFNPGERVLGTTAPLFALWLSGLRSVAGSSRFVAVAVRSNAVWLLASAALLGYLVWQCTRGGEEGMLAAAWVLLLPASLTLAFGGMEIWFFQILALLALVLFRLERPTAALAAASLATLVRPEGALLLGALVVLGVRGRRDAVPRTLLLGLTPLLLWVAASVWYFGSPIPSSVIAKAAMGKGNPPGSAGLRLLEELAMALLGGKVGTGGELLAAGLTVVAVGCALLIKAPASGTTIRLAVVWLGASLLAVVVGNPSWYPWYGGVVLAPWVLVLFLGIWLGGWRSGRPWLLRAVLWILVVTQLVGAAVALHARGWPDTAVGVATPYRSRVLAYAAVARDLNAAAAPGSSLLTSEIGMLGFLYQKGRVVDALSLVTPGLRPYLTSLSPAQRRGGVLSPALVRAVRPDVVVGLPQFLGLLRADPSFRQSYVLVDRVGVPGRDYPQFVAEVFLRRNSRN
jgi:hypothetical protein